MLSLAGYYGLEEAAGAELDALWQHVEAQKATLADAGTVTVVTHNNGAFHSGGSISLRTVGIDASGCTRQCAAGDAWRAYLLSVTADVLAQMAPDTLLVVDRSAAIGAEPLAPETLKAFGRGGCVCRSRGA